MVQCWCIHCLAWMVSEHRPSAFKYSETLIGLTFTCMKCTYCWLGLA